MNEHIVVFSNDVQDEVAGIFTAVLRFKFFRNNFADLNPISLGRPGLMNVITGVSGISEQIT